MASRRWIDGPILAKMAAGLAMMALPAALWMFSDRMSMRVWIVGALGLMLFVWGASSIGDKKSEWERD